MRVSFAALMLAPSLLALSTFFWTHGEYGITGGTVPVLSTVYWIGCFAVLFGLLRRELPVYASLGFIIAVYGCIGGADFGMDRAYRRCAAGNTVTLSGVEGNVFR